MSEKMYGASCTVCGRTHPCSCKKRTFKPASEYVTFRGKRWFVADAEWNPSPLEDGVGSHWHLTLTNPQDAIEDTP